MDEQTQPRAGDQVRHSPTRDVAASRASLSSEPDVFGQLGPYDSTISNNRDEELTPARSVRPAFVNPSVSETGDAISTEGSHQNSSSISSSQGPSSNGKVPQTPSRIPSSRRKNPTRKDLPTDTPEQNRKKEEARQKNNECQRDRRQRMKDQQHAASTHSRGIVPSDGLISNPSSAQTLSHAPGTYMSAAQS